MNTFMLCLQVRYSTDGNVFCSASSDGKVMIYDGKDGTVVSCLGGEKAHSMGVTSLSWGPTATQLLTVSSDRTAKLWDVEANQCVTTFKLGDSIPGDMQVILNAFSIQYHGYCINTSFHRVRVYGLGTI